VSDPFEAVLKAIYLAVLTTVPHRRLLRNASNNFVGNQLLTQSPGFRWYMLTVSLPRLAARVHRNNAGASGTASNYQTELSD
jgi:hypothetical protein